MWFDNGVAKVKTDNPITTYGHSSASISDKNTGELLFYTNGKQVRNADGSLCQNGWDIGDTNILDVLILEDPGRRDQFYLFIISRGLNWPSDAILYYYKVVKGAGNKFVVSTENVPITRANMSTITAVRNCRNGGYWLVMFNTGAQQFHAYSIGKDGIDINPVISEHGDGFPIFSSGDLVSNNAGNVLAVSNMVATSGDVLLFDIDKKCGKIEFKDIIVNLTEKYAFGLSFSPNDEFLYFTHSVGASSLYQYELSTKTHTEIARSPDNFNELQLGPNGKIYISTHTGGIPGSRIDVIHNPNNKGAFCNYERGGLNLGNGRVSNFHFPNFIQDYSDESCEDQFPEFEAEDVCLGETIQVELTNNFSSTDPYWWEIEEDSISGLEPSITPLQEGNVNMNFLWSVCDEIDTIKVEAEVYELPDFDMGKDTTICVGDSLYINLPEWPDAIYNWTPNIGNTHSVIIDKAQKYYVEVDNGGCKNQDSIVVDKHPSIWVDLGEEHFICEDDKELVRLDAGKGFEKYRWIPTRDTTQWIDVTKTDSYFVIVNDFRGCKGEDGTVVKRRCPHYLYFPTAFTPNGDNLNDSFGAVGQDLLQYELQIYNRWGECVFESNDLENRWDGSFKGAESPVGQYLWKCSYMGLDRQKVKRISFKSGKVILVR